MNSRRGELALKLKVDTRTVIPVTRKEVAFALRKKVDGNVLELACRGVGENDEPCFYWKVNDKYYLDDATFGDVVDIETLRYSTELGLHAQGT